MSADAALLKEAAEGLLKLNRKIRLVLGHRLNGGPEVLIDWTSNEQTWMPLDDLSVKNDAKVLSYIADLRSRYIINEGTL